MSRTNAETLRSYEARVDAYVAGTAQAVSGAAQDWLDAAIAGLAPGARIFEVGSAFGRDARYLMSKGVAVTCSDATQGFVDLLRTQGLDARRFDLLTDPIDGTPDLILANAVLLHFREAEFTLALAKVAAALAPGGRFAFSLKRGEGEGWSTAKLDAPRFFRYWQPEDLPPRLAAAGFAHWDIDAVHTARVHAEWLYVLARLPPAPGP